VRYELCTLFDANYLPRGLVLYRSLERVCEDFRLRVFCMDEESREILERLALPRLVPIGLDELEAHDRGLVEIKPTRTQVEYCWTATPAVCLYALEREPAIDSITYLDADLMFFTDPAPIYEELDDDSVLIVPHRYSARYRHVEATSGTYNVQFMTFRRDERGLAALRWWRERCLEWCYNRLEDGKFGDQRYLDDWPQRFEGVHVLQHAGGGLAPWNVEQHELSEEGGTVLVDGRPLVFYHYHSLRLYQGSAWLRMLGLAPGPYRLTRGPVPIVWTTNYSISATERRLLWDPYLRRLGSAVLEVRRVVEGFAAGFTPVSLRSVLLEDAAARKILFRVWAPVRRAASRAQPDFVRRSRRRDSWKAATVAQQMRALAVEQLPDARAVPPLRTFLDAVQSIVDDYDLPAPARLLDIGCGVGHYSELLERHFPGRFVYTGSDYAPEMIAAARAQWPGRTFVVDDLFRPSLDLGSFDVVVASGVVDVLSDYERALDILFGSSSPLVVLHRQRITQGRSRWEIALGYPGQKTYTSFMNMADIEAAAMRHGRKLGRVLPVDGDVYTLLVPQTGVA
jgi:hypothetical protein